MANLAIGIVTVGFSVCFLQQIFRAFRAQFGMMCCHYRAMYHRKPDAPPISIFSFSWDVLWTKNLTDEGLRIRDEYFRHADDWWRARLRGWGAGLLFISLLLAMYFIGLLPDATSSPPTRRNRSRDSIFFPIANEIEDMRNAR